MKYGEEAVYALLDLLNEHEVAYMLVGSFLSNAYGEARATKDGDFVVDLDSRVRKKILDGLPNDFEIDWQVSFETITGHTRQILKIPSIPFLWQTWSWPDRACSSCLRNSLPSRRHRWCGASNCKRPCCGYRVAPHDGWLDRSRPPGTNCARHCVRANSPHHHQ